MAVTYTVSQRKTAAHQGRALVTMDVPGMQFQGPTTKAEAARLSAYMADFIGRRVSPALSDELTGILAGAASRLDVSNGIAGYWRGPVPSHRMMQDLAIVLASQATYPLPDSHLPLDEAFLTVSGFDHVTLVHGSVTYGNERAPYRIRTFIRFDLGSEEVLVASGHDGPWFRTAHRVMTRGALRDVCRAFGSPIPNPAPAPVSGKAA